MKLSLTSIMSIIGMVALLLMGTWLVPRVLGFYDQIRGGQILNRVLANTGTAPRETFLCEPLPAGADGHVQALLAQAVTALQRATRVNPALAQTYRLLGQAFCMLGKPEEAVNVLLKYTHLRPENPLGFLELGFAYEATCRYKNTLNEQTPNQETTTGVLCQNGDLKTRIAQGWKEAGISPEQIYNLADLAFASQQYNNAGTWFQLAALLGGKPDGNRQFKWAVSDVLVGQPLPEGLDANAVSVYTLSQDVKIGGEYLQWMRPENNYWNIRYGQRLYEHSSGDPGIGILWWQGSGVAIIRAPCTAEYRILVRAMHKSTAGLAGQLQVENDLKPEADFTLSEDWQEYETRIVLTKGDHILGIRYVEDVGDALINWVSVGQTKDCEP
jgi:tetratricopeptide (TPR) repeat protein